MGWIGLHDGNDAIFAPGGLTRHGAPQGPGTRSAPGEMLGAGTLFIDVKLPGQEPQKILAASGAEFWPAQLMLHLWPQGRATLQIGDGAAGLQMITEFSRCQPGERLRIMFRWSAAFNAVWLAVESPGRGMFAITRRVGPPPLPLAMLAQLFELPTGPGVELLALSDRAEDIGLGPALAEGTPVRTPDGWRSIEELRPGDPVLTADGGAMALRDISRRELPMAGSFAPATLMSETGPVRIAPGARVLVPGPSRGQETLVRAGDLGTSAQVGLDKLVRYFELQLDRAHLIDAGGYWVETRAPAPGPVARPRSSAQPVAMSGAA